MYNDIPCASRLCYEHDVRPSVRLSVSPCVKLVECDHIVQQEVEIRTSYERGRCLGELHARKPHRVGRIPRSRILLRKTSGI